MFCSVLKAFLVITFILAGSTSTARGESNAIHCDHPQILADIIPDSISFKEFILSPNTQKILEAQRDLNYLNPPPAFRVKSGTRETFNGESYEVMENSGEVFRVRNSNQKEYTLKIYFSHAVQNSQLDRDLRNLEVSQKAGVDTLLSNGYEVNAERQALLAPYIHGLSVDKLFSRPVPADVQAKISTAFTRWVKLNPSVRNKSSSVILEFKTSKFFYIDPD
jgi:hypothetical protein